MADYDNTDRGVLFKNDRKDSDKHPDYKGRITPGDGPQRWLSAWINEKNGRKYLSLRIGDECEERPVATAGSNEKPDFDDDIPF